MSVRLILGTMTIGPSIGNNHADGKHGKLPYWCQTPPDVARAQLKALCSSDAALVKDGPEKGKVMIDTASVYQNWHTEKVLGDIISSDPELRSKLSIHTKANAALLPYRSLSKESVLYQANGSLERLQVKCIDIYYLHGPDIKTPIDDTLQAISELHIAGKIKEFGLSNYPAWKVVDIYYRCEKMGIVKPTVYQGVYNALTRSVEFEGFPSFREFGIRSYHYNPLAGGLLTGKYSTVNDKDKGGRFGKESPISGKMYSARYWHQQYFDALQLIRSACESEGIEMTAASMRWCMHHSVLSGAHYDGLIFGCSSLAHCEQNLQSAAGGPLPDSIVSAFDQAWRLTSHAATAYFRGYGTQPGLSDTFLKKFQSNIPNSKL